jgi:hypothetical protein
MLKLAHQIYHREIPIESIGWLRPEKFVSRQHVRIRQLGV